ncbi:MAG TPA: DNA internalization-related competence protein ComEC/Rec2 [Gaiellaceae bacterium]|nr:DNA internalization-related competence protein ComEC/Rec2 [Gaiellaceae bacterium]
MSRVKQAAELHWPALLVAATCSGIASAIWVSTPLALVGALVGVALVGAVVLEDLMRLVALAAALAVLGLGWGSLRMEALRQSALTAEIGEVGHAELVTVAPARTSVWATRVIAVARSFRAESLRERALLVLPAGRSPPRGALIEATVRVAEPRSERDGFDERGWLARQGIHVVLHASRWRETGRRGGIPGVGDRLRDRVEDAVGRGTDGVRRGIVLGVVLGEDEGLPADVQDDFRASGLYHLLAVSGQNVAFLAGGIYALGWLLRLSRHAREISILGVIAAYVLAVGWQPSVVRAGVAGALVSLAWLAARPRDRWHFLAVGALVLMLWMPTALLEPGFQLSFVAVAAIFVAVPRVRTWLDGYPIPSPVADALAVAGACGVATAPIVLFHFGEAPLYTVLANVIAFPAAPLVLGFGLLAAVVDPLSPSVAAGLAALAGWSAAWLELVARVVAGLPRARVDTRAALAVLGLGAGAWLGVRALRRLIPAPRLVVVLAVGAALVYGSSWLAARPARAWEPPAGLRVTFLDVGQGDAVLLETPQARVLVDQGPPEGNAARQLLEMGVRSLTAIVLTHPQRDHVGGAADVLRRIDVEQVLEPGLEVSGPEHEEAQRVARDRGVPIRVVRAGASFRAGGLALHVLWPADPGSATEDPNANAVVLMATYGTTDVFLPADAESDVTGRLLLGAVEILKVAHHGSEDPGLGGELRDLRPRVAVISAGRDNDYGHPHADTLAALERSPGLATYRTDLDGRVVVEADGDGLTVQSDR